jgi:PAS domain S-box-containing protein
MMTHKAKLQEGSDAAASPGESRSSDAGPLTASAGDELISILLVDDEPRNLVVLETILASPDYRLVCAESAEQALLALVAEEFALLVIDIQMPGMTGFELAQLIKQREKTAGVPIIFLTAYYSEDHHVLEGYGTGAVDYLHKPIAPEILRSKVAVFAELHRKRREITRANHILLSEVTARRRAEEQLRRLNDELEVRVAERTAALLQRERELRSLADNTPDILTRFDQELRFLFVNSALEEATGLPRDGFPGRSLREVGMPEDVCDLWEQSIRSVFETRKPRSLEFGYASPAGARRYATRLVPEFGPTGEAESVLAVTQDITERQRATEALKDADRRKDEFLATLAHELRNPLAPLRNGLELLRLAGTTAAAVETRQMMDRQLSHMVRLIDDLLDLSRITNDKLALRKERVLLQDVAKTAVEASRPIIEASRNVLKVSLPDEPVWLVADAARLSQVISNLLTNAAKYTPQGGCIELSAAREGGEARIRVTDTGLGIPPEMLAQVFEMFTQVNRTLDRSQGGLGIGLAIVKRLVELHGGTITAESPGLGAGSTFTVCLPLIKVDARSTEQLRTPEAALGRSVKSGRRVLVVDDNVDGATSLARFLQLCGHEARTAHSGPEALDVAHPFKPEVVFLDIGLPGMNGYEVAKRFRGEPALSGTLLVALTGWGSEDNKRLSREAGFDFHLTKPAELKTIENILARVSQSNF